MRHTLIRAESVSRRYRTRVKRKRVVRQAVLDVSVDVGAGQWLALLGANGSGKSTLLRILAQMEVPDEGRILHLGDDGRVLSRERAASRSGVVFQVPGLDRLLTVRENLTLQGRLFGIHDVGSCVASAARRVGLSDRLDDRVGELSGGLARRADLARALMAEPSVLMLDEPLSGLDLESQERFLSLLQHLRQEHPDLTIIMATHSVDEVRLADAVLLLDEGRTVALGSPEVIARSIFGDAELLLCCDAAHVPSDTLSGVQRWSTGRGAVLGGSRESIERIALLVTRHGGSVQLRMPDFAAAFPVLLKGAERLGGTV